MEQKTKLSKSTTFVTGILFLATGVLSIYMELSLVGSILLILIGIVGIGGAVIGKFDRNEQS